jgi:putative acetyltransferase
MGSVQFHQADADDGETLFWIKHAAINGIESDAYDEAELDAWKPTGAAVDDFGRAVDSDRFDIILAVVDGEEVGYGVLNIPDGRIDAVYVHPEYSRQGIASSLVGQLESRARMHDIDELKIVSSLNAKSFYERLGYWDFGTKIRTIDGVQVEFAIMHKQLE